MDKQQVLDICWKKRKGELSPHMTWDFLAPQYGFITGEAMKSWFKRHRKSKDIETDFSKTSIHKINKENVAKLLINYNTNTKSKKPRLVVSDIHLPFAIDGWLDFIKETHKKFDCDDEIIINGDLLDFHAFSFHTTEPDAMSGIDEFDKAKAMVKELVSAFPKARYIEGNHDLLIVRRIKEIGIDRRFTKTFHELLELPETWIVTGKR